MAKATCTTTFTPSVTAIRKMGAEAGFAVDASDDPAVFTAANLKQYQALVFSNSNNEAFTNQAQRDAFKGYIESGGGFVGIHSASGSERELAVLLVRGGREIPAPSRVPEIHGARQGRAPRLHESACRLRSSGKTNATSWST